MDSDKIKAIVTQAQALTRGEQDAEPVMEAMVRDMSKSPKLAVGIIEQLKTRGHDLMILEGEAAERFRERFKAKMEDLDERELIQIRKIASRWFAT